MIKCKEDLYGTYVLLCDKEAVEIYVNFINKFGISEIKIGGNGRREDAIEVHKADWTASGWDASFTKAADKGLDKGSRKLTLSDLGPIQTESPEEKELFDTMTQDNEHGYWENGLPPIGCVVLGSFHYDKDTAKEWRIDYISESVGVYTVVESGEQYTFATRDVVLHKPETEAQKDERERMEAAYDLYVTGNEKFNFPSVKSFDAFKDDEFQINFWLSIVDKTSYRKDKA